MPKPKFDIRRVDLMVRPYTGEVLRKGDQDEAAFLEGAAIHKRRGHWLYTRFGDLYRMGAR